MKHTTKHKGEGAPVCPHCLQAMWDFRPLWESVCVTLLDGDDIAVAVDGDCPECGKPVCVREIRNGYELDGTAYRGMTETDKLYLNLTGGRSA